MNDKQLDELRRELGILEPFDFLSRNEVKLLDMIHFLTLRILRLEEESAARRSDEWYSS